MVGFKPPTRCLRTAELERDTAAHHYIVFPPYGLVGLSRRQFSPQGLSGNIWRRFQLSQVRGGGATGIQWVEASDAIKRPTAKSSNARPECP